MSITNNVYDCFPGKKNIGSLFFRLEFSVVSCRADFSWLSEEAICRLLLPLWYYDVYWEYAKSNCIWAFLLEEKLYPPRCYIDASHIKKFQLNLFEIISSKYIGEETYHLV